jgi:hypothetical protein
MKKYQVDVVMSYWQTVEVEAVDADQAGELAYEQALNDKREVTFAQRGEGEVMDVREITTQGERR